MDELLRGLREEGRQDDTGHFTLDPDRARELMRQYQTAAPERYPLMFVAAACRLGASGLTLLGETQFTLEDAELERHEVEHLFSFLLADGPLRYLGMGMLMAEQLGAAYVRLSCGGAQLTLKGGKTFFEKVLPGPLRVEVKGRRTWRADPMPPSRVLGNWARLCPIPITIDRGVLKRVYRPEEPLLGTLVVGNLPVEAPGIVERLPAPADYEAALTVGARRWSPLGGTENVAPIPGEVWCVVDGVAYRAKELLPYWVRGVIVTQRARPDLSMTAIVQTEELKALAQELLELLGDLMERLAEERHPHSADEVRSYAAWRGGPAGLSLLRRVLEYPGLTEEEQLMTLLQTARMEAEQGLVEAAERHLRGALELVRERPRRIDALYLLSECLARREAPAEERVTALRELLALLDRVGRPDGRLPSVLGQLAELLTEGEEARKLNARYLELLESTVGTNHPSLTPILNRLTRICAHLRPLDAERFRQRSLEIWSYAQGRGCEPPAGI